METFSALLAICAGNSPVTGEFPAKRPVSQSFDVFFDLRLNKRLSDLRRHRAHNDVIVMKIGKLTKICKLWNVFWRGCPCLCERDRLHMHVLKLLHYGDVICIQTSQNICNSTVSSPTFSANNKENLKLRIYWLLWGRWPINFPHQGPVIPEAFPYHDFSISFKRPNHGLYICEGNRFYPGTSINSCPQFG